jgi:threonine/homoserine efflux transporter RhtA
MRSNWGALFWTLHVIVLGKYASRFEAMSFSVGQLLVCGILNLAIGLCRAGDVFQSSIVICHRLYGRSFRWVCVIHFRSGRRDTHPRQTQHLILSLESVFAVLSGWLLLNERLVAIQIVGCVLIFLAVLLSQFKEWNLRGTITIHLATTLSRADDRQSDIEPVLQSLEFTEALARCRSGIEGRWH